MDNNQMPAVSKLAIIISQLKYPVIVKEIKAANAEVIDCLSAVIKSTPAIFKQKIQFVELKGAINDANLRIIHLCATLTNLTQLGPQICEFLHAIQKACLHQSFVECAILKLDRALQDPKSNKKVNDINLNLRIATHKLNLIFLRLADPITHLTAVSVENNVITDFYYKLTNFTVRTAHSNLTFNQSTRNNIQQKVVFHQSKIQHWKKKIFSLFSIPSNLPSFFEEQNRPLLRNSDDKIQDKIAENPKDRIGKKWEKWE